MTPNVDPAGASVLDPNPGVVSLNVSALFLWTGGYPDRAYNRAAEAIALAQKLNHPYSLTYAQFHSGLLNMWLRNYEIARTAPKPYWNSPRHTVSKFGARLAPVCVVPPWSTPER